MKYKLINIKNKNLKTIEKEVLLGAKFIYFNYRISLGLVSLLRQSPIIYFTKIEKKIYNQYLKKYNRLNFIFGPWFIFTGPFLTYKTYKSNKKGGVDVTNDIILNLNEKSLIYNEVEIKLIYNIFSKVNKSEKKDITKIVRKLDLNIVPLKKVFIGLFINVDEYSDPIITIGFKLKEGKKLDIKYIKDKLYKHFYKHVKFQIITLEQDSEMSIGLIEQGDQIYG